VIVASAHRGEVGVENLLTFYMDAVQNGR